MAAGRIAVVGAGLAGLSAAVELKKADFEVELFERSRLLGGKATSFEIDGIEVDNGQHVFLACCAQFVDFVEDVGASDLLYLQPRFEALLLRAGKPPVKLVGRKLPAPYHLAPSLLTYGALSFADRIRLATALNDAKRSPPPGETFGAWLDRHNQSPAARANFWEPFLVPALNAPLGEVSAADALFVIRTAFLEDSGAARFGFARVPLARIAERAAALLDRVHLRTAVVGVEVANGRVCGVALEGAHIAAFDAVVLAVPPNRLRRLLPQPESFGIHNLARFRFAPIVDVHLWYDVPTVGFSFAAVLGSPVQWIFEKGPGYLACSMSAAEQFISMSNQELIELCRGELAKVLPSLRDARLVRGAATRDREATFVPVPGLRRPGPGTALPGLAIAGAWTDTGWPATMESAVRSGRAAAQTLLSSLQVQASDYCPDSPPPPVGAGSARAPGTLETHPS